MEKSLVYTQRYFLTAGECDARGEMPMTLIAERLIEIATNHANSVGIGYADLFPDAGWVLSRLGIEMLKTPRINDEYTISTWVETWNRAFSERCFRFEDADGNVIGWARSIWVVINFETRRPVNLMQYGTADIEAKDMECAMTPLRRLSLIDPTEIREYTFKVMDLDFNRHVNSVRYIEHILNLWPLEHYDAYRIDKFEIAYQHECHAGETVAFAMKDTALSPSEAEAAVDILRDSTRVVSSTIHFNHSQFRG